VAAFGKIIAVGLNYSDDVRVSNMPIPSEPTLFLQAASAITDSSHDVEIPLGAQKTDWEVELSVVVGKRGNYVKLERALEYVAGYCIVNNLSECSNELEHGGFAGLGVQQQHAVPPKST
jgi:ureidoglycolate lyase/2,4-diketo-3-deoxy-L-fuconate hydrolase